MIEKKKSTNPAYHKFKRNDRLMQTYGDNPHKVYEFILLRMS